MERDAFILKHRTLVPQVKVDLLEEPMEQFFHRTLRASAKWQHELLVLAFRQYITDKKSSFFRMISHDQKAFIRNAVQQDRVLRHRLFGLLSGVFTTEEYEFYAIHQAEVHRRMVMLMVDRLFDGLVPVE